MNNFAMRRMLALLRILWAAFEGYYVVMKPLLGGKRSFSPGPKVPRQFSHSPTVGCSCVTAHQTKYQGKLKDFSFVLFSNWRKEKAAQQLTGKSEHPCRSQKSSAKLSGFLLSGFWQRPALAYQHQVFKLKWEKEAH